MSRHQYLGDLTGGSLMIVESRILAKLLSTAPNAEEWARQVAQENVLRKKSVHTALRYANLIRMRLEVFHDAKIIDAIATGTDKVSVQFLMVAFVVHSPIVADFMRSMLLEAKQSYKTKMPIDAWSNFFLERVRIYPELVSFAESTMKKMGQNVINALVQTGYLSSARLRDLQPVYLDPEVKAWLVQINRTDLVEILECKV